MSRDMLTEDDFSDLIEALEAWETKDAAGEMIGDLLGAMLTRKDGPDLKFEAMQEKQRREKAQAKALRKERSVILRAKLLEMRNEQRIGGVERGLMRAVQS